MLPAEAGLDERAVSFTKGCYPGQEPIARLHYRGHANRRLRVLALEGRERRPYDAEVAHGEQGRRPGHERGARRRRDGSRSPTSAVEVPDDAELGVGRPPGAATLTAPRARSSGDRALPCGGRGRTFESCRAHSRGSPRSSSPRRDARSEQEVAPAAERRRVADGGALDQLTAERVTATSSAASGGLSHGWASCSAIVTAILLAGLANVFGQRPDTDVADGRRGRLKVYSPTSCASGLFFESRFTIARAEEIEEATLVLDPGWLEGMTLNTLEPGARSARRAATAASRSSSADIPAGGQHRLLPPLPGQPDERRPTGRPDVELHDGERLLLHIDRT